MFPWQMLQRQMQFPILSNAFVNRIYGMIYVQEAWKEINHSQHDLQDVCTPRLKTIVQIQINRSNKG